MEACSLRFWQKKQRQGVAAGAEVAVVGGTTERGRRIDRQRKRRRGWSIDLETTAAAGIDEGLVCHKHEPLPVLVAWVSSTVDACRQVPIKEGELSPEASRAQTRWRWAGSTGWRRARRRGGRGVRGALDKEGCNSDREGAAASRAKQETERGLHRQEKRQLCRILHKRSLHREKRMNERERTPMRIWSYTCDRSIHRVVVNAASSARRSWVHRPFLQPLVCVVSELVQRSGVSIKEVQYRHHEHRASKHWNGSKDPKQQGCGEVHCSQTHRPEVAAPDHCGLDVAHGYVGIQRAHHEAGVDQVSRRLDEAGEGGQEADEQGDVLDGGGGLACVPVDDFGHQHLGAAPYPDSSGVVCRKSDLKGDQPASRERKAEEVGMHRLDVLACTPACVQTEASCSVGQHFTEMAYLDRNLDGFSR
ncbi:hypothetical protein GW17_00054014 [Ensete ventricosum]|nr:hypothetical protein GW17_00054014 [Ensete ventricosum]